MFNLTPIFPAQVPEVEDSIGGIEVDVEWRPELPRTAPAESQDITVQDEPPVGALDVDTSWS